MRQLLLFVIYLNVSSACYPITASFTVNDSIGCAPFTVTFTNTSTVADSIKWDFGDETTSSQANPTHIYYSEGSYTAVLYVYDSLMNADSAKILIQAPSNIPFFIVTDEAACPGQVLQFSVYGNYDDDNVILWDFDDGTTSNLSFIEHIYSNTGIYNIKMTVTNSNCGTVVDSNTIDISDLLIPDIHIHPEYASTVICAGENFPFFYDEDLSILWEFGNGQISTDPYPIYSYDTAGTYTVTITVTNICGNTNTLDTVLKADTGAVPVANFNIPKSIICINEPMSYSATKGSGYAYSWDFGNGDTANGESVEYFYSDTGTYNVTLTVTNLCGNQNIISKTVTVTDTLKPFAWMFVDIHTACPGTEITFITPANAAYLWKFGDGDTGANRSHKHIYDSTGIYPVQLTVTNYCGKMLTLNDTVIIDTTILPVAGFFIEQSSYCPGDIVTFNATGANDIISYMWDFGDGIKDSLKNSTHIYTDTGIFNVKLICYNSCGNADSLTRLIKLDTGASAIAKFTFLPNDKICPGTTVFFENMSSDTSNCIWVFGDGDTSYYANPQHTFTQQGNYFIKLSVTNSCNKNSITSNLITVTQSEQPKAPLVSCSSVNDSIKFIWDPVLNISEYEVSIDKGVSWQVTNKNYYSVFGAATDTVSIIVRATGLSVCLIGASSELLSCTITGINEMNKADEFLIYPNPAGQTVYFEALSENISDIEDIYIYNLLGQSHKLNAEPVSKNTFSVNLSTLAEGIYFMRIKVHERYIMKKIVKIK